MDLLGDDGEPLSRGESAMLSLSNVDALSALAHDLAQRTFGGQGSVGRTGNGIVRLTIVKHDRSAGAIYRERDVAAATLEGASKEIALAIKSVDRPPST